MFVPLVRASPRQYACNASRQLLGIKNEWEREREDERKKEKKNSVFKHANCRKRASWGSDAFSWSSYSGGSSYVLPIWSTTRRASTSRRFAQGAFIQDAKIFASSREEAFHARLTVTPFACRSFFSLATILPLVFYWVSFLFSPALSFPFQSNRDKLDRNYICTFIHLYVRRKTIR